MNTNLLDLNNEVLNIIGGYVKQDNIKEQRNRENKVIFKSMDRNIAFLIRINHFDSNHNNKVLNDIIHDGILTLEECQEYADSVKENICNGLN